MTVRNRTIRVDTKFDDWLSQTSNNWGISKVDVTRMLNRKLTGCQNIPNLEAKGRVKWKKKLFDDMDDLEIRI